ncbi:hypothetical protein FB45DRAFT_906712 [Roridomyces roridus]|uniref:F-box domain-containing protein n=1 Tax=Roridomyces roridus TaxID=1738132 RepID=A0AAD7C1G6_9AGAR|nr:hypothetical protein FB45DRAFT_906712 [Roridomyces roridus]
MDSLPFQAEDVIPEHSRGRRPLSPWDLQIFNFVAFETWKSLSVPKSHRTEDLSIFPATHLDIILEILSHLHPLDLLHVSRTSRSFYTLLLSSTCDSIWRNSFSEGTDRLVPPPLPEIDECGASNTPPNYYFLGRICMECHRDLYLPGYDRGHQIYSLIPSTGLSHLNADGQVILDRYERLKAAHDNKALEQFVKSQKAVVADIRSAGRKCHRWSSNFFQRRTDQGAAILARVEGQLRKEGWAAVDIKTAALYYARVDHACRLPVFSRAFWKCVRPQITRHRRRVAKARAELRIIGRQKIIKAAALNTRLHLYYPPPHRICDLPSLTALAKERSDEPLATDEPRLVGLLGDARAEVDQWCIEQRELLVSLLPENTGNTDAVDLATSVFWIPIGDWWASWAITAGWSSARGFLHYFDGALLRNGRRVEYCERGAATALMLARLLGLSEHTTAAQMDGLPARFVCGQCPVLGGGRLAMAWRECIMHDRARLLLHGPGPPVRRPIQNLPTGTSRELPSRV